MHECTNAKMTKCSMPHAFAFLHFCIRALACSPPTGAHAKIDSFAGVAQLVESTRLISAGSAVRVRPPAPLPRNGQVGWVGRVRQGGQGGQGGRGGQVGGGGQGPENLPAATKLSDRKP